LPELITYTTEEYEQTALALAREPHTLAAIRSKLAENRLSCNLFDTERYTRHLEVACTRMWQICQRGEELESFSAG